MYDIGIDAAWLICKLFINNFTILFQVHHFMNEEDSLLLESVLDLHFVYVVKFRCK